MFSTSPRFFNYPIGRGDLHCMAGRPCRWYGAYCRPVGIRCTRCSAYRADSVRWRTKGYFRSQRMALYSAMRTYNDRVAGFFFLPIFMTMSKLCARHDIRIDFCTHVHFNCCLVGRRIVFSTLRIRVFKVSFLFRRWFFAMDRIAASARVKISNRNRPRVAWELGWYVRYSAFIWPTFSAIMSTMPRCSLHLQDRITHRGFRPLIAYERAINFHGCGPIILTNFSAWYRD